MAEIKKEDIEALAHDVGSLREIVETAVRTVVEGKERRWRRVFGAMGVAVIVSLWAAVAANGAANSAHDAVAKVKAQQIATDRDLTQRRVDACHRDNTQRAAARQLSRANADAFAALAALAKRPSSAQQTAQLRVYDKTVVQPLRALADNRNGPFKDRDCSPAVLNAVR